VKRESGRGRHLSCPRIETISLRGHLEIFEGKTEPQDHAYGEQYNAQDFYGHRLDFTETITDVAPEQWSGGAFHLE
jgi:hypothetical protein